MHPLADSAGSKKSGQIGRLGGVSRGPCGKPPSNGRPGGSVSPQGGQEPLNDGGPGRPFVEVCLDLLCTRMLGSSFGTRAVRPAPRVTWEGADSGLSGRSNRVGTTAVMCHGGVLGPSMDPDVGFLWRAKEGNAHHTTSNEGHVSLGCGRSLHRP